MPLKKSSTLSPVGKKIKKIRQDKKMALEQIANATGCSIEELKEIEDGKKMPSVGTLLQISKALEIDSGFLLKEQESKAKRRIRAYVKRTENYAYTTLTPGAENKHLKAFRVVIDPMQDHKGVGYQHEGEEFMYVLAGKVEVVVGKHRNVLAPGESIHFNSGIQHQLRNISNEQAILLVVLYSP